MLSISAIQGLLKLLLPDMTAIVQMNQDAHSVKRPYAAWKVSSESEIGFVARGEKDATDPLNLIQYIERTKEAVLEIQVYTDTKTNGALMEPREFCNMLINKLQLSSTSEYFRANGIALIDHRDFSNADLHLGDNWERRGLVELNLQYIDSVEEEITTITYDPTRDAGIVGTFINTDGTVL